MRWNERHIFQYDHLIVFPQCYSNEHKKWLLKALCIDLMNKITDVLIRLLVDGKSSCSPVAGCLDHPWCLMLMNPFHWIYFCTWIMWLLISNSKRRNLQPPLKYCCTRLVHTTKTDSASLSLGGRRESFQISQLIARVSEHGEKAWKWQIPHCVKTATPTQQSHDTGVASRKRSAAVQLHSPRAVGTYPRLNSLLDCSALHL